MKIVILILAFMSGVGASIKKSASDVKKIKAHHELNEYRNYPNLLPEVEIVATAKK